MLSPSEVGWDVPLYAREWLKERFRLTDELSSAVDERASPRAVHDLRVACRRLREAVSFFVGVLELPDLSGVDRAARRAARTIGRLREIDVAMKRLAALELASEGTAAARDALVEGLKKRRRRLARERREKIAKRTRRLRAEMAAVFPHRDKVRSADPDASREAALRAFTEARVGARRAEVERLFEGVRRRGRRSADGSDELHAVRVAIKHWRYALEIGRAVMPRVLYQPIALRLRRLQELGGQGQDFADLHRVIEEELARRGERTREQRALLRAVQSSRSRAAIEFRAGLKILLPPSRVAPAV